MAQLREPACHSKDQRSSVFQVKKKKKKKRVDGGLNLTPGKEKGTDLGLPGKLGTVIVVVQSLSCV